MTILLSMYHTFKLWYKKTFILITTNVTILPSVSYSTKLWYPNNNHRDYSSLLHHTYSNQKQNKTKIILTSTTVPILSSSYHTFKLWYKKKNTFILLTTTVPILSFFVPLFSQIVSSLTWSLPQWPGASHLQKHFIQSSKLG